MPTTLIHISLDTNGEPLVSQKAFQALELLRLLRPYATAHSSLRETFFVLEDKTSLAKLSRGNH